MSAHSGCGLEKKEVAVEYKVDMRDIEFQLFEWLRAAELFKHPRFGDWTEEDTKMILAEALKIAQSELAPTNKDGDEHGVVLEDGKVKMPPSFHNAYKTLCEGGWIGVVNNPEFGGMGLPEVVGTAVNELFFGANISLSLTVLLTRGTGAMIEMFGTEEDKKLFVEKLYSGQWTGTMCLTEAQAGSDVGAVKTKAEKIEGRRYKISGEKLFITSGDHDLTENIIHLVLARTPGAPPGTKGLSLFIVPKIRVNPDGSLGEPNDVVCSRVEEKLGIHGSPTCVLVFGGNGGCEGYLLGEENQGMKLMFNMMNAARIEVGLQGGALAGAAHQAALEYAKTRLQSRHWTRWKDKDAPQVPIIEHPDVRRMLLTAKAYTEAIRSLLLKAAFYTDMTHTAESEEERERYQSYVNVLTPICKAWGSEYGFQATAIALQVFGGYGYTKEYPVEQYLRDTMIAMIYEGTNGIQALDFVARKLPMKGGKPIRELLGQAEKLFNRLKGDEQFMEPAWMLAAGLKQLESIQKELSKRPDGILITLLNAVPLLDMTGIVLAAANLLEQAEIAKGKLASIAEEKQVDLQNKEALKELLQSNPDAAFYHDKIQTAIHFAYRNLPKVPALAAAVRSGEMGPIHAVMA